MKNHTSMERSAVGKSQVWRGGSAGLLLGLLAVPWGTAVVYAQAPLPAPIAPPGQGGALPAPIAPAHPIPLPVPPVGAPVGGKAPNVSQKVSQSALIVPLVMGQLLSHKLTAAQAWQNGALTLDDLFYVFEKYIDGWGGLNGQRDAAVRRALAGLLVEHGAERLKNAAALSPQLRLWLADYYQANQDVRAVALAESILAEIKSPVKGESSLVFQTVERLAWYYRDRGEYERGARMWLLMAGYHADVGWWTPDALIEAARLYAQAGQVEKAGELYARVPQYGNGWAAGLALSDQGWALIQRGKHEEARKLLRQSFAGTGANGVRPAMLLMLANSYFQTGDLSMARSLIEESIAQYNALTEKPQLMASFLKDAQQLLSRIEQLASEPIICEPREIYITVGREKELIRKELSIRSFKVFPLTVTTDNPKVKVIDNGSGGDNKLYFQKGVIIQIAPEALKEDFEATLTVSSPKLAQKQVRVPVHVRIHNQN